MRATTAAPGVHPLSSSDFASAPEVPKAAADTSANHSPLARRTALPDLASPARRAVSSPMYTRSLGCRRS
ncbi:hypothetical protein GCM10022262_37390 [Georgenia daeguensis]|uniref:Uncharacterized protein n=1 Tax=Georgenia daeguensis TaxID=908355 RepID=A0ABP6UK26_9MICO